jgi:hypothetical protein
VLWLAAAGFQPIIVSDGFVRQLSTVPNVRGRWQRLRRRVVARSPELLSEARSALMTWPRI